MSKASSKRRRVGTYTGRARSHERRTRRLWLETLEPRQMLSATPIAVAAQGLQLAGDNLPPGLASQTHWLHGEQIDIDAYPAPPAAAGTVNVGGSFATANGSVHPLDSIPQLHSIPGARAKLYLDFDGHVQPDWGGTTPVYDRDGDPTTFSDAELDSMNVIWSRVAEDYAPFNIDVTTVQPPELAAGVPESVANGVAVRIAIGGNGSWTGGVWGGMAQIGSFTNSAPNVAYVFSENFSANWTSWIADAASHEAGHTFGLGHQSSFDKNGVMTDEYNHGSGNWAPIMGYEYNQVTTWSNGTSGGPTDFQDDMAVIASGTNGFGYRADDYGNTLATATPLATNGTTWSASGIIEKNDDVDVFSFTVAAQNVYRMAASLAQYAPNLDAVLQLRNSTGQLLAAAAPYDTQAAEIVSNLVPGTYFLSVLKSAAYGWVGQYNVTIDAPAAAIFVTPASYPLTTSEAGGTSSFSVVLSAAPIADVQIPVSSSNAAEGAASTTGLIFTSTNWNVPQTVTVTGVDDNVPDGDTAYSIVLGAAVSADSLFNGLNPTDVSAINADNDVKFYVVNDATTDTTYRYAADAKTRGTSSLTAADTAPRGVASTIAGDKTWVIDANRNVYVYSASGQLLGSWAAGTMNNSSTPEGIATNGTDIWIVDGKGGKVYRYAGAATRLSGSQSAASSFSLNRSDANPKDIVTDGNSFWVVDDSTTDRVFKYTAAGSYLGNWTIDAANKAPTGITINPANVSDIWIVDSATRLIYQYYNAAFRTSGSQAAYATIALAAGNTNPQGIADPPAPAAALLTGNTKALAPFGITTLHASREASAAKKANVHVVREQAFASYVPQLYDVPSVRGSVTKFGDGSDETPSELLAVEDHAATDLALTAEFTGLS